MKEMKYKTETKVEVLATGYCFGLLYYILSLGTYPTAYIKIPKTSKLYNKTSEEIYHEGINLDVHGGITYVSNSLNIDNNRRIEGWFIGWDYAHAGDYTGFEQMVREEFRNEGKKWTTEEIYKEVREACYQIRNSIDKK